MKPIHEEEYKGLKIKIYQDEDAGNPREECDEAGTMVCWHGRYTLGDKHNFSDPEAFREWWKENGKGGVLLSLFLYDHSGITMRATEGENPFSCPWDSGQVGFIYVTRETIIKEWGKRGKQKAINYLKGEVKTYDDYLTGDVYGYVVEGPDGEELDSCWGYYGDYDDKDYGALLEAKSVADRHAKGIKSADEMEKSAFAL